MKKHTKIYLKAFDLLKNECMCEMCGRPAVDIHHIIPRGMGGGERDTIDNLMALCRECHVKYGDKKQYTDGLRELHTEFMWQHGVGAAYFDMSDKTLKK